MANPNGRFSCSSSVLPNTFRATISSQDTFASFNIISNSVFINHHKSRPCKMQRLGSAFHLTLRKDRDLLVEFLIYSSGFAW
jgi:hypothetical protein